MKNSSVRLILVSGTSLLLQVAPASAFPWPFGKKDTQPAPSAAELQSQDGAAAELLTRAQAAQGQGQISTANSLYKQIVAKYPLTNSASNAQYLYAKNFEDGNPQKAFEEYQILVDSYKASSYFSSALEGQYNIAKRARTDKLGSLLGLKKKLSREDTLKFFKAVVKNAPQGPNAAEAKFEIGAIYEDADERSEAINAYQDVVDQYPKSPVAAQAQKKIADLNFGKVAKGTKDAGVLKDSRNAAQEAVSLFPTEEGRDLLPQIDEKEAESAFKIAKFYERTKNLKAAVIYYNNVLKFRGGSNYEAAKERINALTTADPKLLEQANVKVTNKQLALKAQADVKSRPDYLGPPAPMDLEKGTKQAKMRIGPTADSGGVPVVPIEEPALPGDKPTGKPDDTLLKPGLGDLSLPPVAPLADPTIVPAEPK